MTSICRWESKPPRRKHSKKVSMREQDHIPLHSTDLRNDAIDPASNLFRAFTARAAIGENQPTGACAVDLLGSQSFVLAVIPFDQIAIGPRSRPKSGQLTCLSRAPQRTRQDERKNFWTQHGSQQRGDVPAVVGQWNVCCARVLSA